jgi:predicted O-methyltransferase YrrM
MKADTSVLTNFKRQASANIDARLLMPMTVNDLSGPFDFVFIDADKDWYTSYAKALVPKLEPGGCMTAHNVEKGRFGMRGTREYYEYMKRLPEFGTSLHPKSSAGMAISYRKRKQ